MINQRKVLSSLIMIIIIIISIYCLIVTKEEIENFEEVPVPLEGPSTERVIIGLIVFFIISIIIFIILKVRGGKENGEERKG